MNDSARNKAAVYDWIGGCLSFLCAIHCTLLPLIVTFVPLSHFLSDEGNHFHLILALLLVPIAVVAVWRGYYKHQRRLIIFTALLGVILLIAGLLFNSGHEHGVTFNMAQVLTLLGSLTLIYTHWKNWQLCRCVVCNH